MTPTTARTFFRTIMQPLILLLGLEAIILASVFILGGTIDQLHYNAEDILDMQVANRKSFLEDSMINEWSNLSKLSSTINENTERLLAEKSITLETLQSDPMTCHQLLKTFYADFISALHNKRVSGIYVMFNTTNLAELQDAPLNRTGLFIRNTNPDSITSLNNKNLLLMRAPAVTVQMTNLSIDSAWQQVFSLEQSNFEKEYAFLYEPFQAAYQADEIANPAEYGLWKSGNTIFQTTTENCLTYSQPLVLSDGTVYGVLGIEVLNSYLCTRLPATELHSNANNSYILANVSQNKEEMTLQNALISSETLHLDDIDSISLSPSKHLKDGYTCTINGQSYFLAAKPLMLYNRNMHFADENITLLGAVPKRFLYEIAHQTTFLLFLALLLMAVVSFFGAYFIVKTLSNPIHKLSDEVACLQDTDDIPNLPKTGILEIDRLSEAITQKSRRVFNASNRLLYILQMASHEIAGFEVRENEPLFVTENFFSLLAIDWVTPDTLSREAFLEVLEVVDFSIPYVQDPDGSKIYEVTLPDEQIRYVHLNFTVLPDGMLGLAEDVTNATIEKKRIEYDRDYDLLTGLPNRRAFYREMEEYFQNSTYLLGHAAMIQIDLDNLKQYNDTYGHEWGDEYISQAAQNFSTCLPANGLAARLSGDEFVLFLSGYDSLEEARENVFQLIDTMKQNAKFLTPNGEVHKISFSSGVSWYPEHSQDLQELMKYADFAMYEVKRSHKGGLNEFNLEHYLQYNN